MKFIFKEVGKITKTKVSLCYIEGLANEKILKEVVKRLDSIDIDGILASGYIEEFISDAPLSPFRTVGYTERPDVVAGKLLGDFIFSVSLPETPIIHCIFTRRFYKGMYVLIKCLYESC